MTTELLKQPGEEDGEIVDAMDIATSKSAQEVQAAMLVAQRCPRDEIRCYNKIMKGCKRRGLAERAVYSYPRGGTSVTGPSIRLAEELARCWGNIDFGIVVLDSNAAESSVMAYCWDLESNTRSTKVFTVKHERHTKRGRQFLSDPRDIYEHVANYGARRMRACILAVIPGDIQDDAVTECEKTLTRDQEPLGDRIRQMVAAFSDFGVTKEDIEKRLGHVLHVTSEHEFVTLRSIYTSLKDGMSHVRDWFEVRKTTSDGKTVDADSKKTDRLAEQFDEPEPVDEPADEPEPELTDREPPAGFDPELGY